MTMPESPADPGRRDLLKGAGFAAAATALMGMETAARAAAPKPHIIYILADDLGFADLGYRGSDIATPNLDKLAGRSLKLEQFYTQPLCTPTRAALMTGRYPMRYGLQVGVIPSGGTYGLDPDELTLPQALKTAGYRTALVGKWHLGHADRKYWPRQRGFDSFYGALIGEIDHFKHSSHGVVDWFRDNERLIEAGYDTELFGAEAVRLIGGHDAGTPLFLYLAFTAPHTPLQAPQSWLDRYAHIKDENRRAYAAMVSAMDAEVGRVLAALEKRGMANDSVIVFHSDNGGTRDRMFVGEAEVGGDLPASNAPLREGKGTTFEGGVRVDALLHWPGRIGPGVATGPFHVVDMMPTLAGLAGASLAGAKPLDGQDLWPALSGRRGTPRTGLVLNIDPTQGSVREGKWKLVWTATLPSDVQLFDLEEDPSETTNVATANPAQVETLKARVVALAGEMVPPHFAMTALKATLSLPPAFPDGLGAVASH
jgi:arylsulfatase I/J